MRDVEKASSPKLWDNVGVEPLEFLKKTIAPLMKFKQDVNYNVASYTLKVERLALSLLEKDEHEKKRLQKDIGEMLDCLPRNLADVKKKEVLLDDALSGKFWKDITFDDTRFLLDEFAELMKFKRDEPKEPIIVDIDDIVEQRKVIEFGPNAMQEHVRVYREKVEEWIKKLAKKHPTVQKIRKDQRITESDIRELEETLNSPDLYFTEDVLRQFYKGTFVNFIKEVLGLYKEEKPEDEIRKTFNTFLVENNKHYNADQFNFIRTLESVFAKKHHVEYSDFFDPPFTNFGINAPVPMFEEHDLKEMIGLCHNLENQMFGQRQTYL
jgi:type I restriction enzyme R subunit